MSGATVAASEGRREGCFVASPSFKDWNAVAASGRHFLNTSPPSSLVSLAKLELSQRH